MSTNKAKNGQTTSVNEQKPSSAEAAAAKSANDQGAEQSQDSQEKEALKADQSNPGDEEKNAMLAEKAGDEAAPETIESIKAKHAEEIEVLKIVVDELKNALEDSENETLKKNKGVPKQMKLKPLTSNEEMKQMIKNMQGMYDRCRQIEKVQMAENGRVDRFVMVVENNLKSAINHINMFAKDVK